MPPVLKILKKTFAEFIGDDCPQLAAAMAYYTVFSLPPLLVIVILIAGAVWGQEAVEGQIEDQIGSLIGPGAAEQVQTMIRSASEKLSGAGGMPATLLSIAALLFGATGAFAQLQKALNRAWEVAPDPERGGLMNFLMKRVLSFGMILGVAFLLLVSLALSAGIGALAGSIREVLPAGEVLAWGLNESVALITFTLLFGALFRILPDAEVQWRQVWAGAFFTALLFSIGKFLIGFYLGQSNPGSTFGAAGSLAVILIWIYYSAMILFLGAEFTQVWARRRGEGITPSSGAVRVRWSTAKERAIEQKEG